MAKGSVRLAQADILHSVPQSIPSANYRHLYTAHSARYKQSISSDNNTQEEARISAYVDLEGVQAVALDAQGRVESGVPVVSGYCTASVL
jgi:hypothetical protein